MTWPLALLYLAAGFVAGIGFLTWALHVAFHDPLQRLRIFRMFAERFPESFERAWQSENVLRPRGTMPDALQFGTCQHCQLPWVLKGSVLMRHPDVRDPIGQDCAGSFSRDYVGVEEFTDKHCATDEEE